MDGVKKQKRGGKGKSGITTRDQDSVIQTLSVKSLKILKKNLLYQEELKL